MEISKIPFVKHVGIVESEVGVRLLFNKKITNHLGTIHASAQFTLAETQSGLYLLSLFPDLEGKVVPLLRSSSVKYKNPATKDLVARAYIHEDEEEKFKVEFLKRGRASISVIVALYDTEEVLVMQGDFRWFITLL